MATTPDDVRTVVRALRDDDWPAVHELLVEVALEGRLALDAPDDEAASRRTWAGELLLVAVAVAGEVEEVVGAVRAGTSRPSQVAHVGSATIVVRPDVRDRGVGRALGEAVLAWHREQGYQGVTVDVVAGGDRSALELGRALGLVSVGRVPAGFRGPGGELLDLHVMHRDLSGPTYDDVAPATLPRARHDLMVAAARLFATRGWAGTTLPDVAAEAGTTVAALQRQVSSKGELLWLALGHVVMSPYTDLHDYVEEVARTATDDVDDRLDRLVGTLCVLQERIAPFVPAINESAALDADSRAMQQGSDLRRLRTSWLIVRLVQRGPGQEPDAAELVHVLMMSETYLGFRRTGWSVERYGRWLRTTLDRVVNGDRARA